jgi:hypothetical protein
MNQGMYIDRLGEKFPESKKYKGENPLIQTTMIRKQNNQSEPLFDQVRKWALLGGLFYASTSSWPDISFLVEILYRYLKNLLERHLEAGYSKLAYLKKSANSGLTFVKPT